MNAPELLLTELRNFVRYESTRTGLDAFTWDDSTFLRTAIIRIQQGDKTAWSDFLSRLASRPDLASSVRYQLEELGYLHYDFAKEELMIGVLPPEASTFAPADAEALLECLNESIDTADALGISPKREHSSRSKIMYIEYKGDSLVGPARIGRVTFSQSRKTIYYNDRKLQSLKGAGYKANFFDAESGDWYWISNCRSDGQDTLYPGIIEIDDDVREEYWTSIRERPDLIRSASIRSEGKYSKRRPQPEKPNHPASGPR